MVVRSPIDGLVVVQNTFRGSEFAPDPGRRPALAGHDVRAGGGHLLDDHQCGRQPGGCREDCASARRRRCKFDAYPGLELTARIFSIGAITRPGGMRASFVKDVPVRLKLENSDPRVIPDLSVSCDVIVETEANATSRRKRPSSATAAASRVRVRQERRRLGEAGRRDRPRGSLSVVIRRGLRPGETVALDRLRTGAGGRERCRSAARK